MRRRHFLTLSTTAVGGLLVFSLDRMPMRVHAQSSRRVRVPLRFFDEREALIIGAAAARIFPSDSIGPGAPEAGVIIYTISTNTSGQKLKGDKVLEHFADETGGRAFFPFKIQDVSDAFSQIQDELRSQYAVSYKPAELQSNGRYHSIQILADNKKYKVRARKGYYAPSR